MENDNEGFRVVSRSRKKGRKKGHSSGSKGRLQSYRELEPATTGTMTTAIDARCLTVMERVNNCVLDLQVSSFYCDIKETWKSLHAEFSIIHQCGGIISDPYMNREQIKDSSSGTNETPDKRVSHCSFARKAASMAEVENSPTAEPESSGRMLTSGVNEDGGLGAPEISCPSEGEMSCTQSEGNVCSSKFIKTLSYSVTDAGIDEMNSEAGIKRRGGEFNEIVCYGLGNFSSCVTARFQLGLLILLNSLVRPGSCHLYDPNFTDVEKQILEELGYVVIEKNEEGKRETAEPTLFFMPHCGKPLYNNLLWANWGQRLSNIIILGNSFNNFSERFTDKQLHSEVPYIQKIIPYHRETPVKNNFQYSDIFNDLAFQVFPPSMLQSAPSSLWEDRWEPCYRHLSEVEIILDSSKR